MDSADGIARAESFIKAFKDDSLIVPAVAPHAMYTLDADTLKACRALARLPGGIRRTTLCGCVAGVAAGPRPLGLTVPDQVELQHFPLHPPQPGR